MDPLKDPCFGDHCPCHHHPDCGHHRRDHDRDRDRDRASYVRHLLYHHLYHLYHLYCHLYCHVPSPSDLRHDHHDRHGRRLCSS